MKVFDFNIHLPCILSENLNNNILNDNKMSLANLEYCYKKYQGTFSKSLLAGNFMLFNQNIFFEDDLTNFISNIKNDLNGSLITALIDFRKKDIFEYLDKAILMGLDCIKFHSYNQKITESDFDNIIKICKYVEEKEIIICIDTSFGTSKMYEYDNLKLSCIISDYITKVPIVLLHTGGAKVIDAMLLAEEKKNIFLETSFSILYYLGSSLEKDFAYAYKKIGSNRTIYGSDMPYVDFSESIEKTVSFFQKHKFSSNEIDNIMTTSINNVRTFHG